MKIEFGFFTRPWNQYGLAETLSAIHNTGCTVCGIMRHRINGDSLEYVVHGTMDTVETDKLETLFRENSLQPIIHFAFVDVWNDDGAEKFRSEIDAAEKLNEQYILTVGASAEHRDRFIGIIKDVMDYALEKGITITVKPHGGITNTAADCLQIIDAVDHKAFRVFYDPGNIIHYSGDNPEKSLADLAPYICGVSLKDCSGGQNGDVNILPGTGDVDFRKVFTILTDAGFNGPCLVETLGGSTFDDITDRAEQTASFFQFLKE